MLAARKLISFSERHVSWPLLLCIEKDVRMTFETYFARICIAIGYKAARSRSYAVFMDMWRFSHRFAQLSCGQSCSKLGTHSLGNLIYELIPIMCSQMQSLTCGICLSRMRQQIWSKRMCRTRTTRLVQQHIGQLGSW